MPEMSVYDILGVWDALVFEQMRIRLDMAIERHADFPGSREYARVLNRSLVVNQVRAPTRITFDNVQSAAVKVAGTIQPGLIVKPGYVDHERISFPASHRPTHPAIGGVLGHLTHTHRANRPGICIRKEDCVEALHDL